MATIEDLERAIDQLLDHPLGVEQYQVFQSAGKLYEAYVFGLCLKAVRELEITLTLCGIQGSSTPFVFRGAPGQIHSKTKNYGYAEFSLNGYDCEIHAGIEFKGNSGMTHELDVCIMRAKDAERCRDPLSFDDPPARSLICGWECKFYTRRLPKNLGREFVGLMSDMGGKVRLSGLCSNSDHEQLRKYFSLQSRPYFCKKLTPLEPENEASFIYDIKTELRKLTAT